MFRTAEEIRKNNEMYSQFARDAKARGEYDVATYYKGQIKPLPTRELTTEEKQKSNEIYSQYARDAKARGEYDVAAHYKGQVRR